jgi:hypothetical protein
VHNLRSVGIARFFQYDLVVWGVEGWVGGWVGMGVYVYGVCVGWVVGEVGIYVYGVCVGWVVGGMCRNGVSGVEGGRPFFFFFLF